MMSGYQNLNDVMEYQEQVSQMERLSLSALTHYALDIRCVMLQSQGENTTFCITTSTDRYLLRIHCQGRQTVNTIQSELDWLDVLRSQAGVNVPEPIPTHNGCFITTVTVDDLSEPRHCVLFKWLEGDVCIKGPLNVIGLSPKWTPQLLKKMGQYMGRLHQASHSIKNFSFQRHSWDWNGFFGNSGPLAPGELGKAFTKWECTIKGCWIDDLKSCEIQNLISNAEYEVLLNAAEVIRQLITKLGETPEFFGKIHADLHLLNYLFDRGNVWAIDFDDCGWGYYAYDIAVTLYWLRRNQSYPQLYAAFLNGYSNEFAFEPRLEDILPTFMVLRGLYLARWISTRRDNPRLRSRAPYLIANAIEEARTLL